jgi:hypothetical protein
MLYLSEGDLAGAEAVYLRALAVREKLDGAEHANVASSLSMLGTTYLRRENFCAGRSVV